MTSSVFTFFLRLLVLFGLCLASVTNAATCVTGKGQTFTSEAAACSSYNGVSGSFNVINARHGYLHNGTCIGDLYFLSNGNLYQTGGAVGSVSCTCPTTYTTTLVPAGIGSVPDRCQDSCEQVVTTKDTGGDPSTWQDYFKNTGKVCYTENTPLPQCPPPSILNTQGTACFIPPVCVLPQKLNSSMTACYTEVCTSPAVLSNETGNCEIPACPEGQTRINGVCTNTQCTPPAVSINGICKVVLQCAAPYIEVDGVCTKTTTTVNPDGSTTTTKTTATGSSTGTGTSPTVTNGGAGTGIGSGTGTGTSTTTTTTTTTPTGTNTTSTTTDGGTGNEEKSECDSTKQVCSTTFNGACDSNYDCKGDAIFCAVATATHKTECLMKSLKVDQKNDIAYSEGKAAFDGGTSGLGQNGGIAVASGGAISVNSSNPFSSSCPSDMQLFEFKGTAYVFPFSKYCNIFQIMGAIMLLIASVISMKIIMKQDS